MFSSKYHRTNYWIKYGKNPMAHYFATEYKFIEDAEAALLSVSTPKKVKHAYFNILDWIGDVWDGIKEWATKDIEKEELERYLAGSKDMIELEERQRNWERRKFAKNFYI